MGIAFDDAVKVWDYAEEMGNGYVLLFGVAATMGMLEDLGNGAGVLTYTVVLDRTGKLVQTHVGAYNEASLGAVLSSLLKGS